MGKIADVKAFVWALVPHALFVAAGIVAGLVTGLAFDIRIVKDGGLGPASAHAGAFVLFFLAAVPAFLALSLGLAGLVLSLLITLLVDAFRRRWRRRTLVRLFTLCAGLWPWIDLADADWSRLNVLHFTVLCLLSVASAALGFLIGLLATRFGPDGAQANGT